MIANNGFSPRPYQIPILSAFDTGGCEGKRIYNVWHRRAGKDLLEWNIVIGESLRKVGLYYYLLPTYTQAKKIVFDGITNHGQSFTDYIPKQVLVAKNNQELKYQLKNGSIIQLIGTDNIDSLRGTNPVGCVFSEYAFHSPLAWEIIRPILAANGGWAIFNTTPNGKNHAYDLFKMAKESDKWYTEILTVDDTGIIPIDVLESEKQEMPFELFMQEYYCSFDVGAIGTYYGELMAKAYEEGRITELPKYTSRNVELFLDLGRNDQTAVWFVQKEGEYFNFINHFEISGRYIEDIFLKIDNYLTEEGYTLGRIWLPHDSSASRIDAKQTVLEMARERYGDKRVEYIDRTRSTIDDIMIVRKILPKCRFDKYKCFQGVKALENYRKKYDAKRKVFLSEPEHDEYSHSADGFRYFAVSVGKNEIFNVQLKQEPIKRVSRGWEVGTSRRRY